MKTDPRSCLGGCGATFKRTKSVPLCRLATDLVYARIHQMACEDSINARTSLHNFVWSDKGAVLALLNGNVAEAERRVAYRRAHGWTADPDRATARV